MALPSTLLRSSAIKLDNPAGIIPKDVVFVLTSLASFTVGSVTLNRLTLPRSQVRYVVCS